MAKLFAIAALLAGSSAFGSVEDRCDDALATYALVKPDSRFVALVRYWGENAWGDFRYEQARRLERLYGHAKRLALSTTALPQGEGLLRVAIPPYVLVAQAAASTGPLAFHDATIVREHGPQALAALVSYVAGNRPESPTALAANAMLPAAENDFVQWTTPAALGTGDGGFLGVLARFWISMGERPPRRLDERPVPFGNVTLSDGRSADAFYSREGFDFYFWTRRKLRVSKV